MVRSGFDGFEAVREATCFALVPFDSACSTRTSQGPILWCTSPGGYRETASIFNVSDMAP